MSEWWLVGLAVVFGLSLWRLEVHLARKDAILQDRLRREARAAAEKAKAAAEAHVTRAKRPPVRHRDLG